MKIFLKSISIVALAAAPLANAASIATCSDQAGCFTFSINQMSGPSCGFGECSVEVCMIIDTSLPTCAKSGGSISHVCDMTGPDGCPVYEGQTPKLGTGGGENESCDAIYGEGHGSGGIPGKCAGVSKITMCQEGFPGDTLHWIIKDGSGRDAGGADTGFSMTHEYDAGCHAAVSCQNNLYACGDTTSQLVRITFLFSGIHLS